MPKKPVQDAAAAIAAIEKLENENRSRLNYARRLAANRSRAILIPAGQYQSCTFAGYLLVSVVDRISEAAVYIQDCDDWGVELVVETVAKAEKIFDDLFSECPTYDKEFAEKLRQYGFVHI